MRKKAAADKTAKAAVGRAKAVAPSSSDVRRERSRQRIKVAARRIFAKKGFDAANVSDIVKSVKMSQGSFYYHFPDKKSVLTEMISEFFDEIKRVTAEWMTTTTSASEIADQFAHRIATQLYENRELARIIMTETHNPDPEIRGLIKDFYQYIYGQTQLGLELGMRLGLVRPLDARVVAVALIGMIEQVVAESLSGRDAVDVERAIREITELQNRGIRPASGK
jgi:TetR/AcrR family transcriptional regulator, fatty acid metabolism regulator protein